MAAGGPQQSGKQHTHRTVTTHSGGQAFAAMPPSAPAATAATATPKPIDFSVAPFGHYDVWSDPLMHDARDKKPDMAAPDALLARKDGAVCQFKIHQSGDPDFTGSYDVVDTSSAKRQLGKLLATISIIGALAALKRSKTIRPGEYAILRETLSGRVKVFDATGQVSLLDPTSQDLTVIDKSQTHFAFPVEAPYFHHILVKEGYYGYIEIEGKPYVLAPGAYRIANSSLNYLGEYRTDKKWGHAQNLWVINVPEGEVCLAWLGNKAIILEGGKQYQINHPEFRLDVSRRTRGAAQDAPAAYESAYVAVSKPYIKHDKHHIVNVPADKFAVMRIGSEYVVLPGGHTYYYEHPDAALLQTPDSQYFHSWTSNYLKLGNVAYVTVPEGQFLYVTHFGQAHLLEPGKYLFNQPGLTFGVRNKYEDSLFSVDDTEIRYGDKIRVKVPEGSVGIVYQYDNHTTAAGQTATAQTGSLTLLSPGNTYVLDRDKYDYRGILNQSALQQLTISEKNVLSRSHIKLDADVRLTFKITDPALFVKSFLQTGKNIQDAMQEASNLVRTEGQARLRSVINNVDSPSDSARTIASTAKTGESGMAAGTDIPTTRDTDPATTTADFREALARNFERELQQANREFQDKGYGIQVDSIEITDWGYSDPATGKAIEDAGKAQLAANVARNIAECKVEETRAQQLAEIAKAEAAEQVAAIQARADANIDRIALLEQLKNDMLRAENDSKIAATRREIALQDAQNARAIAEEEARAQELLHKAADHTPAYQQDVARLKVIAGGVQGMRPVVITGGEGESSTPTSYLGPLAQLAALSGQSLQQLVGGSTDNSHVILGAGTAARTTAGTAITAAPGE